MATISDELPARADAGVPMPVPRPRRLSVPIATVLSVGFGGLILLAVASVLLLGLRTTGKNTTRLLVDKAQLAMDGMEARVRAQLEPARAQAEFVAAAIATGAVDPDDPQALGTFLHGALAASPQITGLGFLDTRGIWLAASRLGGRAVEVGAYPDPEGSKDDLEAASILRGTAWLDPEWVADFNIGIVSVRVPVRRDGEFIGAVSTAVSFQDLSRFLGDLAGTGGAEPFILFDDAYVIAHRLMTGQTTDYSNAAAEGRPPLPTLAELGDPIVAAIWQEYGPDGRPTDKATRGGGGVIDTEATTPLELRVELDAGSELDAELLMEGLEYRGSVVDDRGYVYLLKRLADYGTRPWTLVIAFPSEEVDAEWNRLFLYAATGFGILIVFVLLAVKLGRSIGRQVQALSGAALALKELDFAAIPPLPDSRLREVSEAARAFNTMVQGLRWFETYVPKSLVLRLIRRDSEQQGLSSEEREVTVLFTDVKSFSALAESLAPGEVAAWLNAHFSRIAACIEAEGGTVDKFIGDAVMAFWGAPEDQPDHAARALRAARAIALSVRADAAAARAEGRIPVCVRVGIHSGPVVVGNIGAESRINYTIVGDTVNAAARLEALGDGLLGGDCCVVLASGDAVAAAGDCGVALQEIGRHILRGRTGDVSVWRLVA